MMFHHPCECGGRDSGAAIEGGLLALLGVVASEAFAWIDDHGALAWFNQRFISFFGDAGRAFDREPALRQLAISGGDGTRSGALVTSDGRQFEWRATSAGGRTGAGRFYRFRDRTDELRAERTIEEQNGRLRLLAAHTEGIIFEIDSRARLVRVWASDPTLLARPPSELVGHTLVDALGPEVGAWHDEKVRGILRTGIAEEHEYTLDVPNGRRTFVASNVVIPSIERDERAIIYWVRDVTEATQLRLKLLQAERLASVGMLAAGVAHEINNPLGYMLLNISQLQSGMAALAVQSECDRLATLRSACEMLHQGAERVRKIVNDLRTFSRADDARRPTDVHRALEFAIDMTNADVAHCARVGRDYAPLPLVMSNEGRLAQLFINLLCNAGQAIARGCPDDNEIRIVTRTDRDGAAVVEVMDTGAGVPPEILDQIFNPFFTTREAGTGLGLSICHTIVRAMGGQIDVAPRSPRGTTFRVRLPAVNDA